MHKCKHADQSVATAALLESNTMLLHTQIALLLEALSSTSRHQSKATLTCTRLRVVASIRYAHTFRQRTKHISNNRCCIDDDDENGKSVAAS